VFRETLALLAFGIVAGLLLTVPAMSLSSSLIYGLSPRDPASLAGASAALLAIGALAGLVPAWSASRVDPLTALRNE
jgi:ABC-type antimicrobial peptide transport system permease subunit